MNFEDAFNGFSVNDMTAAKQFYGQVLGFELHDEVGGVMISLPAGRRAWMYAKPDHVPAAYTMLNLMVSDIDETVDALRQKGIVFEIYLGPPQDEKGIMRGKDHNMGPNIAWFKDPAGNILSVVES